MRRKTLTLASLTLAALCLLQVGCETTTWKYPEGPVVAKDKSYSVSIPNGWTYLPLDNRGSLIATLDGPALQSIRIHAFDLKDELPHAKEKLTPEMNAEQLVDTYYRDAFKDPNKKGVTMERAGPAKLGNVDGFEITYTYTIEGGLRYREFTTGAIRGNKLVTLTFRAPTRHYYERDDDVVPNALATFTFL